MFARPSPQKKNTTNQLNLRFIATCAIAWVLTIFTPQFSVELTGVPWQARIRVHEGTWEGFAYPITYPWDGYIFTYMNGWSLW